MRKSLLALAVLGAFTGVASAQSSVTLFGVIDLNGRLVKNDGSQRRLSLSQDGVTSSRLGFRGVEDLGGGMRAGFHLEAGVNADTGTANGKFWNRRSTVSLITNAGELRLGRDYIPTFWNQTTFDAFGFNGLGSSGNVRQRQGGVRQDNTIGYFLPSNLGGFYGQFMVGAGEGGTTGDRPGRHIGGRVGFAAGPFNIALAAAQQRYVPGSAGFGFPTGGRQNTINLGASWDFGFMRLMGYIDREELNNAADQRETMGSISAVVPLGQGEFHVGYDRSKLRTAGVSSTVDNIKATYQYNLSKRTAVYGTIARLDNKNGTSNSIAGGSSITALPTAGGESRGFELGIRHMF